MNDFFIVEYFSLKKKRGLYQLINNNNQMPDRSTNEMAIWLLVSAATNITGIPVAYLNYKKGRIFESVIIMFTVITSFMYHVCDSIGLKGAEGIWLSEGQWHRQDNVGAIMCFVILFIYLCDFKDKKHAELFKYIFLCIVILLQEKSPWYLNFTIGPIIASAILFVGKRMIVDKGVFPTCNKTYLKYAVGIHFFAFLCFARGLDEHTDPYRVFHGMWHMLSGIGGWYDWQLIKEKKEKDDDDHP